MKLPTSLELLIEDFNLDDFPMTKNCDRRLLLTELRFNIKLLLTNAHQQIADSHMDNSVYMVS